MKKLLFILALLAMVVLPNVAPAHETSGRRHLSDGVALVALEDQSGRGGEGAGIAALPSEQGATLASRELRFQMPPPGTDIPTPQSPDSTHQV
jgi:hypothetical protein